ncbi:MAG: hypothetical protein IKB06_02495 [Clostridia bacterium]|nr:hypothetical protein [Clostridia bacterium]
MAASKSKTVIDEITFAERMGEMIDNTDGISKNKNSKNKKAGLMPERE